MTCPPFLRKPIALFALLGLAIGARGEEPAWRPLLDQGLSQWEVFLGVPHKTVDVPGRAASTSEDGKTGEPLGLGDPLGVYRVETIDGEPVLRITGEVYGALTSKEEFGDYHLQWQFRWGDKKWPPRLKMKRDSGVLFHCVGRHGAFWNVWMQSLECQVQEGDCGDFISLAGARAKVPVVPNGDSPRPIYRLGGPLEPVGYVTHAPSTESPNGEWTTIDLYAIGQTAVFAVNGVPNMALFETQQRGADGGVTPLTRGRLQVQSEAAEIDYRRLRIRPLAEFPPGIAEHATQAEAGEAVE